jgi:hypothetical protein
MRARLIVNLFRLTRWIGCFDFFCSAVVAVLFFEQRLVNEVAELCGALVAEVEVISAVRRREETGTSGGTMQEQG